MASSMRRGLKRFRAERLADDSGATVVEYGLIVGAVGIVALAGMAALNASLTAQYTSTMPQNGVTVCTDATCAGVDPLAGVANGIPDETGLEAPTLTGVAGNGQVTLSWNQPANTGSAIIGYTASGSPAGTCAVSVTSCVITGLTNNQQYTFRVAARNSSGTGPSSNTVALTPSVPTAPDAPTLVSGLPGDGSVTVSWTAPASTGGSALTSYDVTAAPGGARCTAAPVTTTCDVTGLTNGTAYTFTVIATNAAGLTSAASDPSASVTPVGPPGAPTAVAGSRGDGMVAVTWTEPDSDGGSPLASFTVTASPGGVICVATAPTTTCDVTPLANGSAYTFTVTATNAAGLTGPPSSPSGSVTPAGTPGKPTGVAATASSTEATVSWTAPTSSGGSALASYAVTSTPESKSCTATAPATSCIVSGLTNGTAYTFTVTATNAAGLTSEASDPSTSVTPVGPPGKPTGVTGTPGNAQVSVSWTAPLADGGSPLKSYAVTASGGGATCTASPPATDCTVSGLTNGTAYTFTVTATNNANLTGAASDPSSSVTPVTAPGRPTSVTAVAGNTKATVSWTAPTSNGGSPLASYTVTSTPGGKTCTTTAPTTTCIVTGLTNGTAYTFTVTATNQVPLTGAPSTASNSVTPLADLPGAPSGLTATSGTNLVTLSWTAPASDGGSSIVDYVVEYKRQTSSTWAAFGDGMSTATSAAVTGLIAGMTYNFRVSAVNATGTGLPSSIATAAAQGACLVLPAVTVGGLAPPTNTTNKLNVPVLPADLVGGKVTVVTKNTTTSSSNSGTASTTAQPSASVLWYSVGSGGNSTNRRWVGTFSYTATNCTGTATGTSLTLTK